MDIQEETRDLLQKYGPRKAMGEAAKTIRTPHFFLHRTFLNEQDLLIIFNTKRCRYQCDFCTLPLKSSKYFIGKDEVISQFEFVIFELRHSLSVLDRITLSNEGSVLDPTTFPKDALLSIVRATREIRNIRKIVFETRLEYSTLQYLYEIRESNPNVAIDILTGFETLDTYIRNEVLRKRESLEVFIEGINILQKSHAHLTAYVLYKPLQSMSEKEAIAEAEASIDFLAEKCQKRNIPLTIRLNPMYAAANSPWAKKAAHTSNYLPPKLSNVLELAQRKSAEGINLYIGLSTERLNENWGSYRAAEDFDKATLKQAILFNHRRISAAFD